MTARLAAIRIHPVKSLAGYADEEAEVDDRGVVHDRRFMIVDGDDRFVTQREDPSLARLAARVEGGALTVVDDAGARLSVPLEGGGARREVTVWSDRVEAVDQGDEAAAWLEVRLGRPARLVRMPASTRRAADPDHARDGDLVSFADGFPFLLLGQASIDDVAGRVEGAVDVRRFRPNLVVAGTAPYAEDGWAAVRIGGLRFEVASGCSRCAIVDVDPDRGVSNKDVLKALAGYRKRDGRVWLGVNLVHDGPGRLRVGDPVEPEPG